jgi:hypothetical protein
MGLAGMIQRIWIEDVDRITGFTRFTRFSLVNPVNPEILSKIDYNPEAIPSTPRYLEDTSHV